MEILAVGPFVFTSRIVSGAESSFAAYSFTQAALSVCSEEGPAISADCKMI